MKGLSLGAGKKQVGHTLYTGTQEAPAGTRHKLVTRQQTHMYWLPGRQHRSRHTGLHADTHEQADKSKD